MGNVPLVFSRTAEFPRQQVKKTKKKTEPTFPNNLHIVSAASSPPICFSSVTPFECAVPRPIKSRGVGWRASYISNGSKIHLIMRVSCIRLPCEPAPTESGKLAFVTARSKSRLVGHALRAFAKLPEAKVKIKALENVLPKNRVGFDLFSRVTQDHSPLLGSTIGD